MAMQNEPSMSNDPLNTHFANGAKSMEFDYHDKPNDSTSQASTLYMDKMIAMHAALERDAPQPGFSYDNHMRSRTNMYASSQSSARTSTSSFFDDPVTNAPYYSHSINPFGQQFLLNNNTSNNNQAPKQSSNSHFGMSFDEKENIDLKSLLSSFNNFSVNTNNKYSATHHDNKQPVGFLANSLQINCAGSEFDTKNTSRMVSAGNAPPNMDLSGFVLADNNIGRLNDHANRLQELKQGSEASNYSAAYSQYPAGFNSNRSYDSANKENQYPNNLINSQSTAPQSTLCRFLTKAQCPGGSRCVYLHFANDAMHRIDADPEMNASMNYYPQPTNFMQQNNAINKLMLGQTNLSPSYNPLLAQILNSQKTTGHGLDNFSTNELKYMFKPTGPMHSNSIGAANGTIGNRNGISSSLGSKGATLSPSAASFDISEYTNTARPFNTEYNSTQQGANFSLSNNTDSGSSSNSSIVGLSQHQIQIPYIPIDLTSIALNSQLSSGSSSLPTLSTTTLSIGALKGQILKYSKDQNGCRFIQKQIEEYKEKAVNIVFYEILGNISELMVDSFGNYLCQKLIDNCTAAQRLEIIKTVRGSIVPISLNMHGTRATQKLIEQLQFDEEISVVISALEENNNIIKLVKDLNGNHVIQRCLQKFGEPLHSSAHAGGDSSLVTKPNELLYDKKYSQFIIDTIIKNCVEVACHRHGCCVLQRCFDYSTKDQKLQLLNMLEIHGKSLIQDPFGNYVIQYALEKLSDLNDKDLDVDLIGRQFLKNISKFAVQKFSSNVIEKCLIYCSDTLVTLVAEEIMLPENLMSLIQDPFGNYVIQTALSKVTDPVYIKLKEKITPFLGSLSRVTYGKKIPAIIAREDGLRHIITLAINNSNNASGGAEAN